MAESMLRMDSSALDLGVTALAGLALGTFFFGGLRLTVHWLESSQRPLLLALASFVLRLVVATAGFVVVGSGRWERYAAALLGFFVIRLVLLRLWGPTRYRTAPGKEQV